MDADKRTQVKFVLTVSKRPAGCAGRTTVTLRNVANGKSTEVGILAAQSVNVAAVNALILTGMLSP